MNQPLKELRALMAQRQIDAYLIPAADFHHSEYFSAHFETTRYLSGFTGENCTLIITADRALLWTDGRFFIQAENQMEESFELMRMGVSGVPTTVGYLAESLPDNGKLGFDGRLISVSLRKEMQKALEAKHIRFAWEEDLVDLVWPDRPALAPQPAFLLEEKYAGESRTGKLQRLREQLAKAKADAHILTSLEDIAWLFNIRGDDIPCTPVVFAYALITASEAHLFVYDGVLPEEVRTALVADGVTLHHYDAIFASIGALPEGSRVMVDENSVSMALTEKLPASCTAFHAANPTTGMKAVKNETEIRCWINSHIKDGVTMVRFMKWLKETIGKEEITEISASDKLEEIAMTQPLVQGLSFDTISAHGPNAAMMHYTATPETNATLRPEGFLLVDSGRHYLEGTTDITRTFVLGPITEEMKQHFTAVVRGMLNLADAKFLSGCSGMSLDFLARQPMWELGIDYRCGTGHGVGFLLSVHEGPQSFYFKNRARSTVTTPLQPGMIITDEPGIYLDYRYGIRIENELLVEKAEENEYGQFLHFRHVTYCPIDLDAIDTRYMSEKEVALLNRYHQTVYETLAEHLTEEEAAWLKEATRPVSK